LVIDENTLKTKQEQQPAAKEDILEFLRRERLRQRDTEVEPNVSYNSNDNAFNKSSNTEQSLAKIQSKLPQTNLVEDFAEKQAEQKKEFQEFFKKKEPDRNIEIKPPRHILEKEAFEKEQELVKPTKKGLFGIFKKK